MRSHPTTDHPTIDPVITLGGSYEMHGTPLLNDTDHLVHDRISDLYATASEVRGPRRTTGDRSGLLTRTRSTLGRRLISIGSAVAGQQV